MSLRGALVVGFAVAGACASTQSTARRYRDGGRHELAALYFAAHYRTHRGDAEARQELVREIETALRAARADYDADVEQGRQRAALGAALRREELLSLAHGLDLREFAALSAKGDLETVTPRAAREALAEVDAAVVANQGDREIMALLRVALAFDPDDGELAARYERVRTGLLRSLRVRLDCGAQARAACESLAASLLAAMTRENREVTLIARPGAPSPDTELLVRLEVTMERRPWAVVKQGKAKGEVPRLDRFQEPVKDQKGKPARDEVGAEYTAFASSARAELRGSVEVRDLRGGAVLVSRPLDAVAQDARTYLAWSGDERALGELAVHGTDETPPADDAVLLRRAIESAAARAAREVLAVLEGGST